MASPTKASTRPARPARSRRRGEGGRRHRRLLRREREVGELDRDEARRVVEGREDALDEGGACRNVIAELHPRGHGGDERRRPRAERSMTTYSRAVPGDVVRAGLGAALHHLAREEARVAVHEVRDPRALDGVAGEAGEGGGGGGGAPGVVQPAQQQLRPPDLGVHPLELVDDPGADPGDVEVGVDGGHRVAHRAELSSPSRRWRPRAPPRPPRAPPGRRPRRRRPGRRRAARGRTRPRCGA